MRVTLRVLLVGIVLLAAARPADARIITARDEMQNPGVPVQQPDHVLTFPKSQPSSVHWTYQNTNEVYDIALTADGARLVYTQDSEVLDVWYLVVWVWPEIVLTLLGLAVLWGLWKTVRRRVRSGDTDSPVCARCGYATRGLTRDTCPECGNTLAGKGTTIGITRGHKRARLLLLVGIAAAVGTTYYLTDPPRFGQVSTWFDWRSEGLAERARLWDIDWMQRLSQDTTAVRDVPVEDSSDVHTIVHVPHYKDPTDLLQVFRFTIMMGGYPRPYADDRLHTNDGRTLAVVNNESYAVRIDLTTLEHEAAPGMTDGPNDRWSYRILDDTGEGSYQFQYFLRSLDGTDHWDITLTHSERGELSYTVDPEIVLQIQTRTGRWGRIVDRRIEELLAERRSEGPDRPASSVPITPTDRPFEAETIKIQPVTAADGQVFYRCFHPPMRLSAYVDHGYVVVQSNGMIYLYDLDTARWVAALDPTPVHHLSDSDGTATAVSADRRWFAVRGVDGEKVAVYRLPDPPTP